MVLLLFSVFFTLYKQLTAAGDFVIFVLLAVVGKFRRR